MNHQATGHLITFATMTRRVNSPESMRARLDSVAPMTFRTAFVIDKSLCNPVVLRAYDDPVCADEVLKVVRFRQEFGVEGKRHIRIGPGVTARGFGCYR